MSIYGDMLEYRRLAIKAHCNVTRWKLTEDQWDQLRLECGSMLGKPTFKPVIVLGAPVEVV